MSKKSHLRFKSAEVSQQNFAKFYKFGYIMFLFLLFSNITINIRCLPITASLSQIDQVRSSQQEIIHSTRSKCMKSKCKDGVKSLPGIYRLVLPLSLLSIAVVQRLLVQSLLEHNLKVIWLGVLQCLALNVIFLAKCFIFMPSMVALLGFDLHPFSFADLHSGFFVGFEIYHIQRVKVL